MIQIFAVLFLLKCFKGSVIAPASACASKNAFMSRLISSEVAVFALPAVPANSTCSVEWGVHKTCCDVGSLVRYSIKDQKVTMNAAVNVTESMYLISRDIFNTVNMIQQLSNNNLPLGKFLTVYRASYFALELEAFRSTHQTVLNNFADLESKSQHCWKYIARLRASSLCSICSGRSQVFFKEDKASITIGTCHDVMTRCWSHFEVLVRFIKGVSILIDSLHNEIVNGQQKFPTMLTENIQNVSKIATMLKEIHLVHIMHEYFTVTDKDYKRECLRKSCEKLTNLFWPVLVLKIRPLMQQLELSSGFTYHIAKFHLNELASNEGSLPEASKQLARQLRNQVTKTLSPTNRHDAAYQVHYDTTLLLLQEQMRSNNPKLRLLTIVDSLVSLPGTSPFEGDVTVLPPIPTGNYFSPETISPNLQSPEQIAMDLSREFIFP